MPVKKGMPACPNIVASSLPSKEFWAYEELYDTVFEADEEAAVVRSKYKGVFLVYTKKTGAVLNNFFRYQHAFLGKVLPVKICDLDIRDLIRKSIELLSVKEVRLMLHIREPLKGKVHEDYILFLIASEGLRLGKRSKFIFAIESIGNIFLSSFGITRKCGPHCYMLV
ncbi:MAG: hypothetical protein F7B61_06500 [Caldisphaeraceae archaeon]|nr:hypothetical protein [Caldisphaeraceae archaeon]